MIAIDELDLDVKIYDDITPHEVTEKPEDGCYTYGKIPIFVILFRNVSRRSKME